MEVKITHEDGLSKIAIIGSVTSANAPQMEEAFSKEPDGTDGIIVDAKELEFISSAGLRVILATKKRCKDKEFKIINANSEVMEVFEVTGFAQMMDISKAKRQVSIENCVKIGAGACGEVYRLDDETIIKVYFPRVKEEEILREKDLAKKAFVMGVPTAISYDVVECDGRTGVVYEIIKSKTLAELIRENPEELEKYVQMYADVCKQIHGIVAQEGELPSFKAINKDDIPNVSYITEQERDYLYKFLEMVPESMHTVHGDLNINNIMVQNGECCLIDMGEFSTGTPMFDLSRIVFSVEYAADKTQPINDFYKLPHEIVDKMLVLLLKDYFGTDDLKEAEKVDPEVKWLYPLAWFRSCTSLLKGTRWPEAKRQLALNILHEKLIPFVDENYGK